MSSIPKLEPGLRLEFPFSVTPEMMADFGRMAGDFHPVHTDDDHAQRRGFLGRIVYGGILVSQVSRLIGMELPLSHCVWTRVTTDFVEPLYVNEQALMDAEIEAISEAVQALVLKFRILAADRLIARGKAEVSFAHE